MAKNSHLNYYLGKRSTYEDGILRFNQKVHFSTVIYNNKRSQVHQNWLDWRFIFLKMAKTGLIYYFYKPMKP